MWKTKRRHAASQAASHPSAQTSFAASHAPASGHAGNTWNTERFVVCTQKFEDAPRASITTPRRHGEAVVSEKNFEDAPRTSAIFRRCGALKHITVISRRKQFDDDHAISRHHNTSIHVSTITTTLSKTSSAENLSPRFRDKSECRQCTKLRCKLVAPRARESCIPLFLKCIPPP